MHKCFSIKVEVEEAYSREFKVFNKMDYRYDKILITNDENDYPTSMVRHIKFNLFLEMEELQVCSSMNANFTINNKIIETNRLILRAFNENDLDDFYEYAKVPGVGEMAGWHDHNSIGETKRILELFIKEDNVFAIVEKNTNKVIGSIGIEKYGLEDKLTEFNGYIGREIGYVLSKDYWGKGIMAEACLAIIEMMKSGTT